MSVAVGVIGCGGIARFHFAGLEKAGAKIVRVCDVRPEAAAPWAARYGAKASSDFREVTRDPAVDAVWVTTFSAHHKAICLDAIAAGKAVVCEKTLAENPEDAAAIVRAARAKGTLFYTSYMKRFIPAVEQAKALMPRLGRIVSMHIRAHQCWGDLWSANPPAGTFAHTPPGGKSEVVRRYGGGILVCGGSHILDLAGHFMGRPQRLFARMVTPAERDYDLHAAALLETAAGPVFYEALSHPLGGIGFLRDGWDERFEITGTGGRLELYSAAWDQFEHKASLLVHYDNETREAREFRYGPCSPFERADAFFVKQIEKKEQGGQSDLTGYDVDELIAHVMTSAREGRSVDVAYQLT
jgi:predicted dehydrogenase